MQNPHLVTELVGLLEQALGRSIKIIGILEIGSFAKHEAVPTSDSDLRIYCESPTGYVWQTNGSRFQERTRAELDQRFERFLQGRSITKRHLLNWMDVNKPLSEALSEKLGVNIEFGFADRHFCDFQMQEVETVFCTEYQFLLGTEVLYDTNGWLSYFQTTARTLITPPVRNFYQKRFLDSPPFELETHFAPHEMDAYKIRKCMQLQWVKWAVFAIRAAIGTKFYLRQKCYVYKMPDVFKLVDQHLPEYSTFVREIYSMKVHEPTRIALVERFLSDQEAVLSIFREKTEQIKMFVQAVNALDLSPSPV